MKKPITVITGLVMCAMAHAAADKPNIVIVFTDDMGYADIGCFGAPRDKTPRIDQMAREGRRFASFYAASSVCSASRAALARMVTRSVSEGRRYNESLAHALGYLHFVLM